MSASPASGERAALRGFRSQYDHIAALVYDALLDDNLVQLRLTDPEAGRVDDLVLVRRDGAHGYQFKSSNSPEALTLSRLVVSGATRSGSPASSLLRSLSDGWQSLSKRFSGAQVHFVSDQQPSVSDRLGNQSKGSVLSPQHFAAFLATVLIPVRERRLALSQVDTSWGPAIARLRDETGLVEADFARLLLSLHFDLGARSPLAGEGEARRGDIVSLSDALYRLVSSSSSVVELDRAQLLALVGWTDRPHLRSRHDFPVDADTYTALSNAIVKLDKCLSAASSGYAAVVGPPGAGKSTLLSQVLSGSSDRIIRYYAYIPGRASARTRMSGEAFLHDLVLLLRAAGLQHARRELVSRELAGLRQQLAEQVDAASADYAVTGRRTIVVVDGLDHVQRDHAGPGSLLGELPEPAVLPDGVIFVVGSRSLGPVPSRAKAQIVERMAVVDLRDHRLSAAAVMQLCLRSPVTATLPNGVHAQIARLSAGHPLAVSYLLNRLRDADGRDPSALLSTAPPYAGDVAQEYRSVWDSIGDDMGLIKLLGVVSRLRVDFTTSWLRSWNDPETVHVWSLRLQYLFRRSHDGWRFFHDSFRQFAADRTAEGELGGYDSAADASWHATAADLCARGTDEPMLWEELNHRAAAGQDDAVLSLAQQPAFRFQFQALRAPELISDDIAVALKTAAGRADIPALLGLVLARVELSERSRALDDVDLPAALLAAGLAKEAVAYAGEHARRVPLAQAYGLATALGQAGSPSGRELFDAIDHEGWVDRGRTPVSGREDDAAVAWTRAAVRYRPLETVLTAVGDAGRHRDGDRDSQRRHTAQAMRRAMIAALDDANDTDGLLRLEDVFLRPPEPARSVPAPGEGEAEAAEGDKEDAAAGLADLAEAGVLVCQALARRANADADRHRLVEKLQAAVRGQPMYQTSALAAAELFLDAGNFLGAARLVERLGMDGALTAGALSYGGEEAVIEPRITYWRLRHVLAARDGAPVPPSVAPSPQTPAGDDIAAGASSHTDTEAIALAARIDEAVRTLARIDAATRVGDAVPLHEAWASLVPLFDLCTPSRGGRSATHSTRRQHRLPLLRAVFYVAERHGSGLLRLAANYLTGRVEAEPADWSPHIRRPLGSQLRTAGFATPWYAATLAEMEQEADAQDVHSRLEGLAELVHVHAAEGDEPAARRLAMLILDAGFGIGYRKDYQFDEWVGWLGRALAAPGGERWLDDAGWLARLIVAANPRTEGAPGRAAAALPAGVVVVGPVRAVRVLEYLISHGTVSHSQAVSELIAALLRSAQDPEALSVAADLITDIVVPASVNAQPAVASAFADACRRLLTAPQADDLIALVSDRVDPRALHSTRRSWRQAFGLPVSATEQQFETLPGDYGWLTTTDGTRISRADVPVLTTSVLDIAALRRRESPESTFAWREVLADRAMTLAEIAVLLPSFDDGSKNGGQALAVLAERAEVAGDDRQALAIARRALAACDAHGWAASWDGGGRRRAAAVLARTGGQGGKAEAALDLASCAESTDWLASMLLGELADVITALDPASDAAHTWPVIREYLAGMASSLGLPADDPLALRGSRWWMHEPGPAGEYPAGGGPLDALLELAARHLTHPTWSVREGAIRVSARALARGTARAADAVLRLASIPGCPDDVLEAAGRAVTAARDQGLKGEDAALLDELLTAHPSQVIRDLSSSPSRHNRPLPLVYRLSVPPEIDDVIGGASPLLDPHRGQYAVLAYVGGVELETVLAVAARRARELLTVMPSGREVQQALQGAEMVLAYPSPKVWASRGAFGRVLADFKDAGILSTAPNRALQSLRTVDPRVLSAVPTRRPPQVPDPPPAGHDQRLARWTEELPERLHAHLDALTAAGDGWSMLAGTSRLSVLNWDELEEQVRWGTVPGTVPAGADDGLEPMQGLVLNDLIIPARAHVAGPGEALAIVNAGWTLHQWPSDWVGIRPDVATALGWHPDGRAPGSWRTADGRPAVDQLWWMDGWWGHYAKAFDDTAAEGYAVMVSTAARRDLRRMFGYLTTSVSVTRSGRHGDEASTARAFFAWADNA